MPNLVSHYLLASDVIERAEGRVPFLSGHESEFYIGTQGPDLLFYSFLSLRDFHPLIAGRKYGSILHRENGSNLLEHLCQRIQKIQDPDRSNGFKAFTLGLLAHLVLDRETHPLTYYLTGFDRGHLIRHSRLESAYAVNQCREKNLSELIRHPDRVLPEDERVIDTLDQDFAPVLGEIFKIEFPAHPLKDALKAYRRLIRFVSSPLSAPVRLGELKSLRMDPRVGTDAMNSGRRAWRDPETGDLRNDSFDDLFNRAEDIVLYAALDLAQKGFCLDAFKPYLNGLNYEGYSVGGTMRYHSPDQGRKRW